MQEHGVWGLQKSYALKSGMTEEQADNYVIDLMNEMYNNNEKISEEFRKRVGFSKANAGLLEMTYRSNSIGRDFADFLMEDFEKQSQNLYSVFMLMAIPGMSNSGGKQPFPKEFYSKAESIAIGSKIKEVDRLVENYGGKASDWKKMKSWDKNGIEWH
jgi:hypothetical protein